MIIGIQGVQGCGKSTLVNTLCSKDDYESISIDDFYLPHNTIQSQYYFTREKRWRQRGNPGTHDIDLLESVLSQFKRDVSEIQVPVYDKTAHNGQGDRIGFRNLKKCQTLLLEGWCIGFISKRLHDSIDSKVKEYECIHQYLDALLILKPPYLDIVYEWREEAEENQRKNGKGMKKNEIKLFIDMYMWCYHTYLPDLYRTPPVKKCMIVQLDTLRRPVSFQLSHDFQS